MDLCQMVRRLSDDRATAEEWIQLLRSRSGDLDRASHLLENLCSDGLFESVSDCDHRFASFVEHLSIKASDDPVSQAEKAIESQYSNSPSTTVLCAGPLSSNKSHSDGYQFPLALVRSAESVERTRRKYAPRQRRKGNSIDPEAAANRIELLSDFDVLGSFELRGIVPRAFWTCWKDVEEDVENCRIQSLLHSVGLEGTPKHPHVVFRLHEEECPDPRIPTEWDGFTHENFQARTDSNAGVGRAINPSTGEEAAREVVTPPIKVTETEMHEVCWPK